MQVESVMFDFLSDNLTKSRSMNNSTAARETGGRQPKGRHSLCTPEGQREALVSSTAVRETSADSTVARRNLERLCQGLPVLISQTQAGCGCDRINAMERRTSRNDETQCHQRVEDGNDVLCESRTVCRCHHRFRQETCLSPIPRRDSVYCRHETDVSQLVQGKMRWMQVGRLGFHRTPLHHRISADGATTVSCWLQSVRGGN